VELEFFNINKLEDKQCCYAVVRLDMSI